jgi:hypothetical protein
MAPAGKNYIPSGRPASPGPLAADFFQQQIAKQRNNNYHSTSLRNMVATSVNRTALHPGGVQYVEPSCPLSFYILNLVVANHLVFPSITGPARATPSWRKSSTRLRTLTMTESQL